VIECLERVYNVSLSNSSDVSKFHVDKPLTEIFESATKVIIEYSMVLYSTTVVYQDMMHVWKLDRSHFVMFLSEL
jgi:hypothetical protein